MKSLAAVALALGALVTAPSKADLCEFSAERTASLEAGAVKKIVIQAGAGDLVIRGNDEPTVTAKGTACASTQHLLEKISIDSRREGDTVYLKTILPDPADALIGFTRYSSLDLTVSVPRSAALSVEDSSGALELSRVASAVVEDSSGEQTIRDIAGDLDVSDSSGEITIERVGGRVTIKDSSGDVAVEEVAGDVLVTIDSSGDLNISKVAGSVRVKHDSSGDIDIREVKRDVTVDIDSSGSIRVERVGGNFTVERDGSGSISHRHVLGSVSLPDDE